MKIIDGKKLAKEIRESVKNKVQENFINKGKEVPCLACIIVEGNSASEIYVRSKIKACEECLLNPTNGTCEDYVDAANAEVDQ